MYRNVWEEDRQDRQDLQDLQDHKEIWDIQESQDSQELQGPWDNLDHKDLREGMGIGTWVKQLGRPSLENQSSKFASQTPLMYQIDSYGELSSPTVIACLMPNLPFTKQLSLESNTHPPGSPELYHNTIRTWWNASLVKELEHTSWPSMSGRNS
ncbi:hypothetical protein BT96DRAFT_1005007 [Gymnopus androsaceus JB14]|uniref:Uncharacterized protein n=1 Tax=Gymnopus androsaceus JB14 TaxID=1447944 RepID=A0A6A4GQH7_9AGAR|nr:hypothetical protein BT96DRAFT_1005007 [Gymnopus androsaceus JB14]